MPHHPKPFFKPNRNTWYVEVARAQHPLGKHPDSLPPPKKKDGRWDPPREIVDAYHRLMAELHAAAKFDVLTGDEPPLVAGILDEFVGWLKGRVAEGSKAARALDWYADYLRSFLDHLRSLEPGSPEVPALTVNRLQPLHVYRWVDSHPEWKTGKRGAMIAGG